MRQSGDIHRIYAAGGAYGTPWWWCLWGELDQLSNNSCIIPTIENLQGRRFFCFRTNHSGKGTYGASLDGLLCNTSKIYVRWVQLTSHESENAQKAQKIWQTTSPWCWSCSPLHRHGFDEPMPPEPEGWAALHMFVPRQPSKRFSRFNKLK